MLYLVLVRGSFLFRYFFASVLYRRRVLSMAQKASRFSNCDTRSAHFFWMRLGVRINSAPTRGSILSTILINKNSNMASAMNVSHGCSEALIIMPRPARKTCSSSSFVMIACDMGSILLSKWFSQALVFVRSKHQGNSLAAKLG